MPVSTAPAGKAAAADNRTTEANRDLRKMDSLNGSAGTRRRESLGGEIAPPGAFGSRQWANLPAQPQLDLGPSRLFRGVLFFAQAVPQLLRPICERLACLRHVAHIVVDAPHA